MTPVTNDALDLPVHYWIGLDIPSRRTCFGVTIPLPPGDATASSIFRKNNDLQSLSLLRHHSYS